MDRCLHFTFEHVPADTGQTRCPKALPRWLGHGSPARWPTCQRRHSCLADERKRYLIVLMGVTLFGCHDLHHAWSSVFRIAPVSSSSEVPSLSREPLRGTERGGGLEEAAFVF